MAALLVAMSVTAILMTVALPVWKQMERREKEEELIFRGQQYVRALRLFSAKYANASPPNIDVLVEQRFLRRKYKDPITNDDFLPILAGQPIPGTSTAPQTGAGAGGRGGTAASPFGSGIGGRAPAPAQAAGGATGGRGVSPIGTPGAGSTGGVMGVASKSKAASIRLYNGRSHYNEWAFINTPQQQAPGVGAPGAGAPGQRGGTPQPGTNPFGTGIGGQRGRGVNPGTQPATPGRGFGPGQSPFQPVQPVQPVQPGRGRGGV